MGKVIFTKQDGEQVKISELTFKMFSSKKGLYSYDRHCLKFDDSVVDIMFENCKFDGNIKIDGLISQNITFNKCTFESCRLSVLHANDVVLDCSYFLSDIYNFLSDIYICSVDCLIKVNADSRINTLDVTSQNISILSDNKKQEEVNIGSGNLTGDSISIKDVFIKSIFNFSSNSGLLEIKNSSLVSFNSLYFTNKQLLVDKKTIFESPSIYFFNREKSAITLNLYKEKDTVVLLGQELLEGKPQTYTSLISVLKGFANRITEINEEKTTEYDEKLDSEMEEKRVELAIQIAELEKKQADLELSIQNEKDKNYQKVLKTKIKEIPYK